MCMRTLFIDVGILREIKPTGCVSFGDILTYECTVMSSPFGTTVWTGSAFNCTSGEIALLHQFFTDSHSRGSCNHGATHIAAKSIYTQNNFYTSQLNVTLTPDIVGQTIKCATDDGGHFIIHHSTVIPTATGSSICKHVYSWSNHLINN